MKAIVITQPGGPEVLVEREVPTPEPGPDQIRVKVSATGINRADLLQRMGAYDPPPGISAEIPGLEFAGVVDAVGRAVQSRKVGDRVFGIIGGGAYAEYVVTHERGVAVIPDTIDDVTAAGIAEAYITAHDALVSLGGARLGSRVLIHAVGSGVGLAAVQIAHALHATVWGTARTPDKLERAKGFGLDHALTPEGFDAAIARDTDGQGVDVVVDFVGAPYLDANLRSLAVGGRLIVVGVMGGVRAEVDLRLMLHRRLTIIGTTLRSRPLEEKIAVTQTFAREVVPLLADGTLKPVIDVVLPWPQAREAHERMAANANFGKIVLRVG